MKVLTAIISMVLVSLLIFPIMAFAAAQPINLFLNGKQLVADVAPRIIKDNTVVPIRVIAESLGSKVKWEEKSRKVTLEKDDTSIHLVIDKLDAIVNNKPFALETAPTIIEGSTMLPLRFVSEQLGAKVTWDDLSRSVFMYKSEGDTKQSLAAAANGKTEAPAAPAAAGTADGAAGTVGAAAGAAVGAGASGKATDKLPGVISAQAAGDNADVSTAKTGASVPPIPAGQTQTVQSGDKPAEPVTIIHSISMDGDHLIVNTNSDKALPVMTKAADGKQIVIDVPNGKLDPALKLAANGEGIIQPNNQSVSQIRYLLFSKDSSTVRIIIDLTKKLDLKPLGNSTANQLVWSVIVPKERYRVIIDPGHGGKDTGAMSINKRPEKDFVLSLGTKIQKLLEKEPKIEALITRKDDTFVELPHRADFANDRDADLFVSVHGNSAGKESIQGVETYYYTEHSLPFAKAMHQQLLKSTGFPDRKIKQSGFYVVKNTTMPSLLLEVGFLSNQTEENAMFQDAFQNRVAASIVAAIKQQLNIE